MYEPEACMNIRGRGGLNEWENGLHGVKLLLSQENT